MLTQVDSKTKKSRENPKTSLKIEVWAYRRKSRVLWYLGGLMIIILSIIVAAPKILLYIHNFEARIIFMRTISILSLLLSLGCLVLVFYLLFWLDTKRE